MILYTYFSDAVMFLGILCVAKYIYGENLVFERWAWATMVIGYVLIEILANIFLPHYEYGLIMVIPAIILFLSRKKRRLGGAMIVFPALLMLGVPYCMVIFFVMVLTNEELLTILDYGSITILVDMALLALMLWVYNRDKKTKGFFELNGWDRLIFICIALLVYISLLGLDNLRMKDVLKQYEMSISIFTLTVISMLLIAGGMSIIKNKSMQYYKNLIKVHSYYMEAQLKHFEAYKQSQKEARQIKHDLKNHMLCIEQLVKERKYEQLEAYVKNFVECVEEVDKNIYTGHDIVDAILQEKQAVARKDQVKIQVEGDFRAINRLKPVDVCTLIANGIDNAIEASRKMEQAKDRWIKISMQTTDNHMLLKIINPVKRKVCIKHNKIKTTKMNKERHGYGLQNIQQVVNKYKGELILSCEAEQGEGCRFILETLFAIKE